MPLISQETTLRSQSLSIYFALQIYIQIPLEKITGFEYSVQRESIVSFSQNWEFRAVNSCVLFFFVDVAFVIGFHSSILMSVSSLKIAKKATKNEP